MHFLQKPCPISGEIACLATRIPYHGIILLQLILGSISLSKIELILISGENTKMFIHRIP
jgi:hypothetical protein